MTCSGKVGVPILSMAACTLGGGRWRPDLNNFGGKMIASLQGASKAVPAAMEFVSACL